MRTIIPHENRGLNIIIAGCGKVGITLIDQLSKEGHYITVIDKNPTKLQTLSNNYDVMTVCGNGASYSVQREAGIESADLIIAVTDSDELNLLCCTVASRSGKCSAIARVRTPDYSIEANYLKNRLGLARIINPELEAANEVTRILSLPTALDVTPFAHGQVEMVKIKIPENSFLDNMEIQNISKNISTDFLISAVERNGEVFIPSGSFILKSGDIMSVVAARRDILSTIKKMNFKSTPIKNTLIIGGGKVAYYLAKQLLNIGFDVKIIEQDRERCEELSILLPKAIIINGDGTDEDLLKEEGIHNCDSFVPLTGIDEENIMLTLYASKVSNAKAVTKINRINFTNVIAGLDLGSVVYPRFLTSEAIIAYVRAMKNSMNSGIETLSHLFNQRVEAIEFKIKEAPAVTNIPLIDLKLKNNLLICVINRNGRVFIPSGQDCFMDGDSVVLVTTHRGFNDINDILK
ncbi:MAG: Trk system potassium transporter TrkA [Lachnospiraceae bacterium]|nr:Trk system potassium transporter TrkA [Lachnoclostridium sp.]MDY2598542.1 Trk system potassium transporter TrkA [Lachnospiraceae bacterium]